MQLPRRLSEPGPLLQYLALVQSTGYDKNVLQSYVAEIRNLLNSKGGAMLLDLLEKSTLEAVVPINEDPRALAARNAQSFIALDLRRIMSDEFNATLEQAKAVRTTGPRKPRERNPT